MKLKHFSFVPILLSLCMILSVSGFAEQPIATIKDENPSKQEALYAVIFGDDFYGNPNGHIVTSKAEIREIEAFLDAIETRPKDSESNVPIGGYCRTVMIKYSNNTRDVSFYDDKLAYTETANGKPVFYKIKKSDYQKLMSFFKPVSVTAYAELIQSEKYEKDTFCNRSKELVDIYQQLNSLKQSTKYKPDDGQKLKSKFGEDYIRLFMDGPDGFHEYIIYKDVVVLDVAFPRIPYDSTEEFYEQVKAVLFE